MKKITTTPLLFLLIIFSISAQVTSCDSPWIEGEATYYTGIAGTSSGHCSLPVAAGDVYHAALNHTQYANSEPCGSCVQIVGPKGEVTVKIVDECPECKFGDIDLARGAFPAIADIDEGRVKIRWQFVPCPRAKDISLVFDPGSNPYYSKLQVRDAFYNIKTLEFRKSNGAYVPIPRTVYNYFVYPEGMEEDKSKMGPYHFRLTSFTGDVIEADNVPFSTSEIVHTGIQFDPLPCHRTALEDLVSFAKLQFQNPFKDEIVWQKDAHIEKLELLNLEGKVLVASVEPFLSTKNISAGIYLLRIIKDGRISVLRMIKF